MLAGRRCATAFLAVFAGIAAARLKPFEDPDFRPYLPSTCQKVISRGQECERRQVRTEDGYVLAMHRLHSKGLRYGPPVLFIHGLLSASDQWLIYGRDHDLASILADKGYDVWLGDLRGNVYSRSHVTLSPDDPKFWDFSFHEHGYYDLPAMLDYIRLNTGHKKVFYVGYSLGGTVYLAMGAARPDYNNKIRAAVVLAPYIYYPPGLPKTIRVSLGILGPVLRQFKSLEVFPRSNTTLAIAEMLCSPKSRFMPLCKQVYEIVFGMSKEVNENLIQDVMSTFFAGSSLKTLKHCYQIFSEDSFRYYDYEAEENIVRYGQPIPPEYDLTKITSPVSVHYSLQDLFFNAQNVERLAKSLPNLVGKFAVSSTSFSHMDFMVGRHARELVYEDIFHIISKS